MTPRELEARYNDLLNKELRDIADLGSRVEQLREYANSNFITRLYYEAKYEGMMDRLERVSSALKDYNSAIQEFNQHKGRVAVIETEIEKITKQVELVDIRSEARHDKVMNALSIGLKELNTKIDERGGKNMGVMVGVISMISMLANLALIIATHFHP
jgi:chromosome segregation ATPase